MKVVKKDFTPTKLYNYLGIIDLESAQIDALKKAKIGRDNAQNEIKTIMTKVEQDLKANFDTADKLTPEIWSEIAEKTKCQIKYEDIIATKKLSNKIKFEDYDNKAPTNPKKSLIKELAEAILNECGLLTEHSFKYNIPTEEQKRLQKTYDMIYKNDFFKELPIPKLDDDLTRPIEGKNDEEKIYDLLNAAGNSIDIKIIQQLQKNYTDAMAKMTKNIEALTAQNETDKTKITALTKELEAERLATKQSEIENENAKNKIKELTTQIENSNLALQASNKRAEEAEAKSTAQAKMISQTKAQLNELLGTLVDYNEIRDDIAAAIKSDSIKEKAQQLNEVYGDESKLASLGYYNELSIIPGTGISLEQLKQEYTKGNLIKKNKSSKHLRQVGLGSGSAQGTGYEGYKEQQEEDDQQKYNGGGDESISNEQSEKSETPEEIKDKEQQDNNDINTIDFTQFLKKFDSEESPKEDQIEKENDKKEEGKVVSEESEKTIKNKEEVVINEDEVKEDDKANMIQVNKTKVDVKHIAIPLKENEEGTIQTTQNDGKGAEKGNSNPAQKETESDKLNIQKDNTQPKNDINATIEYFEKLVEEQKAGTLETDENKLKARIKKEQPGIPEKAVAKMINTLKERSQETAKLKKQKNVQALKEKSKVKDQIKEIPTDKELRAKIQQYFTHGISRKDYKHDPKNYVTEILKGMNSEYNDISEYLTAELIEDELQKNLRIKK